MTFSEQAVKRTKLYSSHVTDVVGINKQSVIISDKIVLIKMENLTEILLGLQDLKHVE